ncbi:hypothetical protein Ae201684_014263 [Aphanomyces euteiches]|uniref:Integrase catalytic domain-containing protein n=1 Tax=Aphanomyces euteiches TaxID=100861 RepID=A0A6G0WKE9_9STRA|nr:hypothetical protein Ae201684_014263 [Aphanomyces euteiches]
MFIDQASRYIFGQLLKTKADAILHLNDVTTKLDNQLPDSRISNLYTDGGGEYASSTFRAACQSRGITQKFTNTETPEENHLAEKTNEHVFNKVRIYMTLSGLPSNLWGFCFQYVIHVYNNTPQELLNQRTPYEVLFNKPSRLYMLKTFGCLAYKYIPKSQRPTKLTNPAIPCIFLGYAEEQLGYKLWDPKTRTITVSRSVKFDETKLHNTAMFTNEAFSHGRLSIPNYHKFKDISSHEELAHHRFTDLASSEHNGAPHTPTTLDTRELEEQSLPKRAIKRPKSFEVNVVTTTSTSRERILEPSTMREMLSSQEVNEWKQAMDEEYQALIDNRVWRLSELPTGRKALKSKWIWKVKYLPNGEVERFKARLCIKGFLQIAGVDFTDTFAPVLRLESLRVLCGLVAILGLETKHLDIKTAFLHGDLDEEIYMDGYVREGSESLVCSLQKSLYGLKQVPRQ